jgi:hypothetical protein
MSPIVKRSFEDLFTANEEVNLTDSEQAKVKELLSMHSGNVANNAGFTLLRISKELKLADLIERMNENGMQVNRNLPFGKEVIRYADSQPRRYSLVLISNDQVLSESLVFEAVPTTIAVCLFAANLSQENDGRIYQEGTLCSEEIDEGNFPVVKWVKGGIGLTAGFASHENKIRDAKIIGVEVKK